MATPITREEVRDLIESGTESTVVEALPQPYFDDAHLPGACATSRTTAMKRSSWQALPDRHRTVVVYCSNLACQNSTVLSRRLTQLGYTNVR